jgi:hypothetical protein
MTNIVMSNEIIESSSQGDSSALSSVIAAETISQSAISSTAQVSVMVIESVSQIIYPSDAQMSFMYIEAISKVAGAQVLPIF